MPLAVVFASVPEFADRVQFRMRNSEEAELPGGGCDTMINSASSDRQRRFPHVDDARDDQGSPRLARRRAQSVDGFLCLGPSHLDELQHGAISVPGGETESLFDSGAPHGIGDQISRSRARVNDRPEGAAQRFVGPRAFARRVKRSLTRAQRSGTPSLALWKR